MRVRTVRRVATLLREPWCISMLMMFFEGCEKQTAMWLRFLVSLPRGPSTVTMRVLMWTLTVGEGDRLVCWYFYDLVVFAVELRGLRRPVLLRTSFWNHQLFLGVYVQHRGRCIVEVLVWMELPMFAQRCCRQFCEVVGWLPTPPRLRTKNCGFSRDALLPYLLSPISVSTDYTNLFQRVMNVVARACHSMTPLSSYPSVIRSQGTYHGRAHG